MNMSRFVVGCSVFKYDRSSLENSHRRVDKEIDLEVKKKSTCVDLLWSVISIQSNPSTYGSNAIQSGCSQLTFKPLLDWIRVGQQIWTDVRLCTILFAKAARTKAFAIIHKYLV